MSLLDSLLGGYVNIQQDGAAAPLPARKTLVVSGATVADNGPTANSTQLTVTGGAAFPGGQLCSGTGTTVSVGSHLSLSSGTLSATSQFSGSSSQLSAGDGSAVTVGSGLALSASGGGGGWQTAVDIDFSAQPSQSLSSDGNYTIAGVVFVKFNSSSDAAPTALVSGQGIIFQPISSTDITGSTRTNNGMTLALSSVVPNFSPTTPIRVSLYQSANNASANYDAGWLEVGNQSIFNPSIQTNLVIKRSYGGQALTLNNNGSPVTFAPSGLQFANNVLQIVVPSGILGMFYQALCATWSGAWPNQSAFSPIGFASLLQAGATLTNPSVWSTNLWEVGFGGQRAGSPTAFSVTVARLRVEYLA